MKVLLGNASALQNGESVEGARVLEVNIPDEVSLSEAFVSITDPRGVWGAHAEADSKATWVESDNPALQFLLAQHFGAEEGQPDNVEATHYTLSGPPGVGPDGPVNKDGSVKASARKAQEDSE